MTFYIQGDESNEGIYVYNRNTHKIFYMGKYADKHPTWGADGKRIFFHEEGVLNDSSKAELARVGYYNVNLENGEASLGSRVILADTDPTMGKKYIYQKHPAYHSGLNLVFFHAQDTVDGKKTIGVISLDHPEHKPILLDLTFNGQKVKGAEHADVSDQPDSPLYYVAKVNGEKNRRLLTIDFEALKKIKNQFD